MRAFGKNDTPSCYFGAAKVDAVPFSPARGLLSLKSSRR